MLPPNPQNWAICRRYDCGGRELIADLQNRYWACTWLQPIRNNSIKMLELRRLLSEENASWGLFRTSDETVIEHIADLLSRGVLHVHAQPLRSVSVPEE